MVFPILGGNSAVAGYSIDNSLRFNDDDNPALQRTGISGTLSKAHTFSVWIKRGNLKPSGRHTIAGMGDGSGNISWLMFNNDSLIYYATGSGTYALETTAKYRDVSAWYHIVVKVDTTQSSASDRFKYYVNGVEQAFTGTVLPQNHQADMDLQTVGFNSSDVLDGYMAEFHFLDGVAYDPTYFGEFDSNSGIWKPIEYTGGNYGTFGFYLDFENSGSLGADQSGNGNNFTATNLGATDQTTDTPTNNFATLNSLRFSGSPTYSEGNLKAVTTSAAEYVSSSIAVKTGKWYWETRFSSIVTSVMVGVQNVDIPQNTTFYQSGRFSYGSTGSLYYDSASESLATYTTGDIIGIALDMDGDSISWYKNNTLVTTKTLSSYTIDTSKEVEHFIMSGSSGGSAGLTVSVNYGQNGSFNGTETAQGNSDGNGYGDFYYAPPSGYLALCTQNLATELSPTIDDGSAYFHTQLYTGDGQSSKVITNDANAGDFQPDWVWIKERSSTSAHLLFDSTRGTDKRLRTNGTNAEETFAYLSSFDTDGFTIGTSDAAINENTQTYVAWQWLANGGTTSSNTDGSITSTVQANTTAGFSIVTYTGTGSNATIGHGLGKVPAMIITKTRDNADNWGVYHQGMDATAPQDYYIPLNLTNAKINVASTWNDTAPTSSVFSVGTNGVTNDTGGMVAYCFAEIEGYSKFGSYTGNSNSSNGTFVYTGFRPAMVIGKAINKVDVWWMHDIKRNTFNPLNKRLMPNASSAEGVEWDLDYLSNGFKFYTLDGQANNSSYNYLYMAFAENPFVTSSGVPVTAR